MATFDIGETVICSIIVKDSGGTPQDPVTSMTITIKWDDTIVINAVAMTKDSTGTYHYDFQTATQPAKKYEVTYIATNGTRISIEKDTFEIR